MLRYLSMNGSMSNLSGGNGGFGGGGGGGPSVTSRGASLALLAPSATAVDASGNVYVADAHDTNMYPDVYHDRVVVFGPDGGYQSQFGGFGSGYGTFREPSGIAVAADGSIYVADAYLNVVQKFDANHTFQFQWGGYGSDNGKFLRPRGVAVDAAGNVYVTDSGNNRVQKFGPDGAWLASWGAAGDQDGQFLGPVGVAVGPDGSVYVCDTSGEMEDPWTYEWRTVDSSRVQKFTPAGEHVRSWGGFGSSPGQFSNQLFGHGHLVADGDACPAYDHDGGGRKGVRRSQPGIRRHL